MKNVFAICFSALFSLQVLAQATEPPADEGFQKEKLFFGGNFGLSFGDYTLVDVSPQVGYRFSHLFAAGMGINAQYVSTKQRYANGDPYSKTAQGVAGLNIFARLFPVNYVMLQVQPEANYIFGKQTWYNPPAEYKLNAAIVPSLLIGGGVVIPSGRGAFIASVFYDALQKPNAPYGARPIYKFGFNFGL